MAPIQRERVADGIEVLRLDRPEARNAMNSELLAAVEAALAELASDAALRVLIFSTTDTKALSAGADVREELDAAGGVARMEAFARFYAAVEAFPLPTIAVCVGNVVGAGAELAAGCDLRVGGDNLHLAWADAAQRAADPAGVVNCLRPFPSRGIRVWGARTAAHEPAWRYINVVRLFQTTARWMERNLADAVMEPHDTWLSARIRREVNDYLFKLFRRGALKGATPQEAYFLKCDEDTTPSDVRERGQVVVDVGLAPLAPAEFIIVRFVYGEDGLQAAPVAAADV